MTALTPYADFVEAPAAEQFPTYPVAWYLFGESRELGEKPLSKDLLGRRLVAFRTASGSVAVLDARCSHLRADLGNGCVVGETVQCPYHHWRYGADGCFRIACRGVRVALFRRGDVLHAASALHGAGFALHCCATAHLSSNRGERTLAGTRLHARFHSRRRRDL